MQNSMVSNNVMKFEEKQNKANKQTNKQTNKLPLFLNIY